MHLWQQDLEINPNLNYVNHKIWICCNFVKLILLVPGRTYARASPVKMIQVQRNGAPQMMKVIRVPPGSAPGGRQQVLRVLPSSRVGGGQTVRPGAPMQKTIVVSKAPTSQTGGPVLDTHGVQSGPIATSTGTKYVFVQPNDVQGVQVTPQGQTTTYSQQVEYIFKHK